MRIIKLSETSDFYFRDREEINTKDFIMLLNEHKNSIRSLSIYEGVQTGFRAEGIDLKRANLVIRGQTLHFQTGGGTFSLQASPSDPIVASFTDTGKPKSFQGTILGGGNYKFILFFF